MILNISKKTSVKTVNIFRYILYYEVAVLYYLSKILSISKNSNKGIVFIKYMIQINILKRINNMSQDKFSYDIERNDHQGMFIY